MDPHSPLDLAREMIRIKSYSGQERNLAEFVKTRMEVLGFDRAFVDDYGNAVGIIRGQGPRTLLFDGHLDTVPVAGPREWSKDPFGGQVEGGRLFGRGASDMKGAIAAALTAAASLAAQKDRLGGSLVFSASTWEERYEGFALSKVIQALKPEGLFPGLVIIGEASELRLIVAQRGRAELAVNTFGRPCHASTPELGVNAVHLMGPVIRELERLVPPVDPVVGKGIYALTDIISTPYPGASVIPSQCRITLDRRLLPGETEAAALGPIQEIIDRLGRQIPDLQARVEIVEQEFAGPDGSPERIRQFYKAWKMDRDNPLVGLAQEALAKVGLEGEPGHYSFCTNGSYTAGAEGIPTLGFGPSREALAHVVDEYIEVDQLLKAEEGYQALFKAFLNQDRG